MSEMEVRGLVQPPEHTDRAPDEIPYIEHLEVETDGDVLEVPVTDVRVSSYDFFGSPPEEITAVDFDRVVNDSGEPHAEADYGDATVIMARQPRPGIGRNGWQMHYVTHTINKEFPVVWERDES